MRNLTELLSEPPARYPQGGLDVLVRNASSVVVYWASDDENAAASTENGVLILRFRSANGEIDRELPLRYHSGNEVVHLPEGGSEWQCELCWRDGDDCQVRGQVAFTLPQPLQRRPTLGGNRAWAPAWAPADVSMALRERFRQSDAA